MKEEKQQVSGEVSLDSSDLSMCGAFVKVVSQSGFIVGYLVSDSFRGAITLATTVITTLIGQISRLQPIEDEDKNCDRQVLPQAIQALFA